MEATSIRLNKFVNDNLVETYQNAVKRLDNNDLVLVIKENGDNNLATVYERKLLISKPGIPQFLLNKISKPANKAPGILSHSEIAFWFIVFYANGESECAAVKTTLMAPGGSG